MTRWVADGTLKSEGYGNWRTIYAADIKGIRLAGVGVGVGAIACT